jgi:hypothetical protein
VVGGELKTTDESALVKSDIGRNAVKESALKKILWRKALWGGIQLQGGSHFNIP